MMTPVRRHKGPKFSSTFIFASLAATASLCGAQEHHVVNQPLAASFDKYSLAAERGDSEAASRLFRESKECLIVEQIDTRLSALISDKHSSLNYLDSRDSVAKRSTDLNKTAGAAAEADASRAMCAGLEGRLDNEKMYGIALRAAELGDTEATACFISAPWTVEAAAVDIAKAKEYGAEAKVIGDQALAAGDWRVVRALANAAAGSSAVGYAPYIHHLDHAAQLRYTELLRLGAAPGSSDANNLDLAINILSSEMTPAEVSAAEQWARKMYSGKYSTIPYHMASSACRA
jgi:hypothetical protein